MKKLYHGTRKACFSWLIRIHREDASGRFAGEEKRIWQKIQ